MICNFQQTLWLTHTCTHTYIHARTQANTHTSSAQTNDTLDDCCVCCCLGLFKYALIFLRVAFRVRETFHMLFILMAAFIIAWLAKGKRRGQQKSLTINSSAVISVDK